MALAGLATVKVADAALLLWRPLAWKVSLRPGIVEPAKPLGTANEAATWPPAVAFAEASTVAPKVTSTRSEGAKPRQERVTRAPAGPLVGERAQLAWLSLRFPARDSRWRMTWPLEASSGADG